MYVIDSKGVPRRVGLTPGNEFSDPAQAEGDPGAAAHSKLRPCSIGPELSLEADFDEIRGSVSIRRDGEPLWSADLATGDRCMRHPLTEIEASLFQHPDHRRPGDVHVHFLGGAVSSYARGVRLKGGDQITVSWEGFGRPLVNQVEFEEASTPAAAQPL